MRYRPTFTTLLGIGTACALAAVLFTHRAVQADADPDVCLPAEQLTRLAVRAQSLAVHHAFAAPEAEVEGEAAIPDALADDCLAGGMLRDAPGHGVRWDAYPDEEACFNRAEHQLELRPASYDPSVPLALMADESGWHSDLNAPPCDYTSTCIGICESPLRCQTAPDGARRCCLGGPEHAFQPIHGGSDPATKGCSDSTVQGACTNVGSTYCTADGSCGQDQKCEELTLQWNGAGCTYQQTGYTTQTVNAGPFACHQDCTATMQPITDEDDYGGE